MFSVCSKILSSLVYFLFVIHSLQAENDSLKSQILNRIARYQPHALYGHWLGIDFRTVQTGYPILLEVIPEDMIVQNLIVYFSVDELKNIIKTKAHNAKVYAFRALIEKDTLGTWNILQAHIQDEEKISIVYSDYGLGLDFTLTDFFISCLLLKIQKNTPYYVRLQEYIVFNCPTSSHVLHFLDELPSAEKYYSKLRNLAIVYPHNYLEEIATYQKEHDIVLIQNLLDAQEIDKQILALNAIAIFPSFIFYEQLEKRHKKLLRKRKLDYSGVCTSICCQGYIYSFYDAFMKYKKPETIRRLLKIKRLPDKEVRWCHERTMRIFSDNDDFYKIVTEKIPSHEMNFEILR